jgi:hypothetical protein
MEHFFDGYKDNPEFSFRALEAAVLKGATHVVLCDTNGGSLPHEVEEIVGHVFAHVGNDVTIGIHCHDDTGCAVANSMAAVRGGASHVQGTLNGLGERTGNANLTSIIPNLQLKQNYLCLPEGHMERLTVVSHRVAETLNRAVNPQAPYVGSSAFAHKAGLHVSAIVRAKDAYEHVSPELVGNGTRFVVSEMAGKATIQLKADDLGLDLDGPAVMQVIDELKRLEHGGYHFEAADASLELLMRRAIGWQQEFFRVESLRVITDESATGEFNTEATVKAEFSRLRIDDIIDRVEDWHDEIARKEALGARFLIDGEKMVPIMGPELAMAWDVYRPGDFETAIAEYDYTIQTGSMRKRTPQYRVEVAEKALGIGGEKALAIGDLEGYNKLWVEWLKASGVPDADSYALQAVPPPEEQGQGQGQPQEPQPPAAPEIMAIENGEPVLGNPQGAA